MSSDPFDPENLRLTKKQDDLRLTKKQDDPFGMILLKEVKDRSLYAILPPACRLLVLLRLKFKTNGKKPIALAGEMLEGIGIDPSNRSRYLRQLEAAKLVKVATDGRVSVLGLS
jgi:DNA-binding MarR family transcriptional regulator